MSNSESVTELFQRLPHGDRNGVQQLWERYFPRLVGLAQVKLKGLPRTAADEEDVALSAFDSVIRAVENQRFPKLDDRDDLWQVLVMVTSRKAVNCHRNETRAGRDYRRVQKADRSQHDLALSSAGFIDLISREPDPAFAASVAEQCGLLMGKLPNVVLRAIALAKMEGYTNKEIANMQQCSLATIERKLGWIRDIWNDDSSA